MFPWQSFLFLGLINIFLDSLPSKPLNGFCQKLGTSVAMATLFSVSRMLIKKS